MASIGSYYITVMPDMSKFSSTVTSTMKTLKTTITASAAAMVASVTAIGAAALSSYSDYEQLVGGVDKLYGTASKKLQEYAENAYATSGMSVNEYMETATQFSASLISSLEGDVDKAADLTDVAMRAMSDNVDTFGTDMESVSNAFKGFAKQNYTMLDNLKLGYGGTKDEMQRLIDDANKYAATIGEASDLSIDSFADIITAIELVQQKQNIAGTTAKEASTTIQGSLRMVQKSWENLLVAFGTGDSSKIQSAVNGIIDGIFGSIDEETHKREGGLINNVMPIVKNIAKAIMEAMPSLIGSIGDCVIDLVRDVFGDEAANMIASFVDMLVTAKDNVVNFISEFAKSDALKSFVDMLVTAKDNVVNFISEFAKSDALKSFVDMLKSACDWLSQNSDKLSALLPVIAGVVAAIATFKIILTVGQWVTTAVSCVKTLGTAVSGFFTLIAANPIAAVIAAIVAVVAALVTWINTTEEGQQFWSGLCSFVQSAWQGVCDFFSAAAEVFGGIWDGICAGVEAAGDFLGGIFQGIQDAWQAVCDWFEGVGEFWGGVWDGVTGAVDEAGENIGNAWEDMKTAAGETWDNITSTVGGAVDNIKQGVQTGWDQLKQNTSTAFDAIKGAITNDMEAGRQAASQAGSALQAALNGDWATAKSDAIAAFTTIKDNIGEKLSAAKEGAINVANAIGEKLGFPGLGDKVAGIFGDIKGNMTNAIAGARDAISGILDKIKGFFSNFKITLPHINLPHFVVSPQGWQIGDLLSGVIPSLSIQWYAKGGVIQPNNPRLIGVGDAREREWIEPESKLLGLIKTAVRNVSDGVNINVSVTVNAEVTGRTSSYEIGQDIGRGISSVLKQRGYECA